MRIVNGDLKLSITLNITSIYKSEEEKHYSNIKLIPKHPPATAFLSSSPHSTPEPLVLPSPPSSPTSLQHAL
jgi:hypothetical protein